MPTINTNGKVAYIYNQATDTWNAISAAINTAASYTWNGTQTFATTVVAEEVIRAKGGINNFLNPSARDTAIPSPVNGVVAFIRQDSSGNVINQIQYYYNGAWRNYNDSILLSDISASRPLALSDVGKTIKVDSASDVTLTIPLNSTTPFIVGQRLDIIRYGSGNVTIAGETVGVTINSKNSNKKISARYSGCTLIKIDTNTWILIGDLTA